MDDPDIDTLVAIRTDIADFMEACIKRGEPFGDADIQIKNLDLKIKEKNTRFTYMEIVFPDGSTRDWLKIDEWG